MPDSTVKKKKSTVRAVGQCSGVYYGANKTVLDVRTRFFLSLKYNITVLRLIV